jgi:ATP-dependent Lon protease
VPLQDLKRRVVLAPEDAGARYDLAEALFGEGKAEPAIVELEKALALDPDHDNALRLLWRCYRKEGRLVPAERALREALRRRPNDREVREELAEVLLAFDRPDDALMHLEEAVVAAPDDAELRKKAAALAMRRRLLSRARGHLERALAIDAADSTASAALAAVRLEQGEVEGAAVSPLLGGADLLLGRARAALDEGELRGSGEGPLRPVVVALRRGDAAGAKRALATADASARAAPAFPLLAGEIALALGDRAQARRFFDRAAGDPAAPSPMALARLAEIDTFEGRHGDAAAHLRRALVAKPDDAAILEALGDVLAAAGEAKQALDQWQAALRRRADPLLAAKVQAARSAGGARSTVGVIGALGYSAHGGTVSTIEAVAVPGKGELVLTGNVARVGREATQVAHSCLKARAAELGIERAVTERDLHVHYVDTEYQKDGPSAGLALALAGLSAFSGRPLRVGLVASGEITLQGAVRAVGGLHEKVVAAWLHEQRFVILPRKNLFQARELPVEATSRLEIVYADSLREALAHAFEPPPR